MFDEVTYIKMLHEPASLAFVGHDEKSNVTKLAMYEEYQFTKFCELDFSRFPMDTQTCHVRLHSKYERELQIVLNNQ